MVLAARCPVAQGRAAGCLRRFGGESVDLRATHAGARDAICSPRRSLAIRLTMVSRTCSRAGCTRLPADDPGWSARFGCRGSLACLRHAAGPSGLPGVGHSTASQRRHAPSTASPPPRRIRGHGLSGATTRSSAWIQDFRASRRASLRSSATSAASWISATSPRNRAKGSLPLCAARCDCGLPSPTRWSIVTDSARATSGRCAAGSRFMPLS